MRGLVGDGLRVEHLAVVLEGRWLMVNGNGNLIGNWGMGNWGMVNGRRAASGAWRRHVGVLALYGLLALAMTWPLARQVGTAIPGDSFDGWQNVWNLWWMREAWLVQHGSAYCTSLLHAPTGVDLRFQTMAPFNGLATLPIQLTAGLLPAYNAAVLLSFVLGGYGAYLLGLYALRQVSVQFIVQCRFIIHSSAFLAGVIFAFSPYHFAHSAGPPATDRLAMDPLLRALPAARAGSRREETRFLFAARNSHCAPGCRKRRCLRRSHKKPGF